MYASGAGTITIPVPKNVSNATATVDGKSIPATVKSGKLTVKLEKHQYGCMIDINMN